MAKIDDILMEMKRNPTEFATMIYAKYAIITLESHVKKVAAIGYIKRLGKAIRE